MKDGFNWFVLAVIALGFLIGMMVAVVYPFHVPHIMVVVLVVMICAFIKFLYTPVRGVEDDQE